MAVVEVPKVKIEKLGLQAVPRVRRGERDLAARRPAGGDPRGARPTSASASRLPENRVRGVRTVDLASAAYPVTFAFDGAARGAQPVHQHRQPARGRPVRGLRRPRCARSPGSRRSPRARPRRPSTTSCSSATASSSPTRCSRRSTTRADEAVAELRASRRATSTTSASTTSTCRTCGSRWARPSRSTASASRASRSSRTRSSSSSARRWTRSASLHPMQWAWYVPGGMDDVIDRQPRAARRRRRARQGRRDRLHAGPHRRQPQPRRQHATTASG